MTAKNSTGKHGANTWTIEFQDVSPDHPVFSTHHELRRSAKGRQFLVSQDVSMKGYQRGKGDYSAIPFTERRFVSWDGEGGNIIEGPHCAMDKCGHRSCDLAQYYRSLGASRDKSFYVLFGNSDGDHIHGYDLSTVECLNLIESADKDAIHIGFAFGYDVNMILKDLSKNHLRILKERTSVVWKQWRIEYIPKKWFLITNRRTHKTVRIWDVFSFFMCSALKAWEEYGIPVSEGVIAGKKARGTQSYLDLHEIREYWREENDAYVALADKLRMALHSADLFISSWHGPGAIATYSLRKHGMGAAMANVPEPVNEAAQYAYGGGRFELFKVGRAGRTVYEYDINSAYPYAISQLPNLSHGRWVHKISPNSVARFGVYRISWRVNPFKDNNMMRPMPFFHRNKAGLISFPCVNETWVWSPELKGKLNFPGLTVHEGWEFIEDDPTDRPFAWLAENYAIRKQYKLQHNPAQLALKLQMNSMYGKMAQRIGWNEEKLTAPKWHQLEWAGWVVSYCRAMVFHAALYAGNHLVAFETDAVFSTKPLREHLDIGDNLGQWEETIYDDFIYLQSGCRFALPQFSMETPRPENPEWKPKYRGFDPGSLSMESALAALANSPDKWVVVGQTSRFVGFAQALHTNFDSWREFQSARTRDLRIGGEGKRRHLPNLCRACREGIPGSEGFHDCALGSPVGEMSHKHPLPWKDAELLLTQQESDELKHEIDVNL
jgi:hypothetical protein